MNKGFSNVVRKEIQHLILNHSQIGVLLMNAIFKRRSVRNWNNKKVEREKIEKLLRAAMQAPSAGNQRGWEFIVIEKKSKLTELSAMSPYSGVLANASVAIVLVVNLKILRFSENWEHDLSAAAQNMLIQSVDEGLGGVWLGVTPINEREEFISGNLELPDYIRPFCVIALGYPEKEDGNKFIDYFNPKKIHFETYNLTETTAAM